VKFTAVLAALILAVGGVAAALVAFGDYTVGYAVWMGFLAVGSAWILAVVIYMAVAALRDLP
jgi:hypothetical protein